MAKNILKTAKTVIIILLFLLTLALSFLYFFELIVKTSSQDSDTGSGSIVSEISDAKGLVSKQLLPEAIAVKESGKSMYALTIGNDFMNDIYYALSGNIRYILGDTCSVESYNGDFDRLTESDEYIYIRYHAPLPASVIYAHSAGDLGGFNKSELGEIYEIMIPQENEGEHYAYTRDIMGNAYVFSAEKATSMEGLYGAADLSDYRDASALLYAEFYGINDNGILPTTIVFPAGMSVSKLSVDYGCDALGTDAKLQKEIASMLGISPDKTGSYYDEETGSIVYMHPDGTLTENASEIVFTAENNQSGGIPLTDIAMLGEETDALTRCLSASENLVKRVKNSFPYLLGGDAEPIITNVRKSGNTVVIEYGCFYNNMELSGIGTICRVELTNEKLSYFSISPLNVTAGRDDRSRSISPYWIIDILINENAGNGRNGVFTIIPKYTSESVGNALMPEYIPVKIRN